jgi:hypothetical protein
LLKGKNRALLAPATTLTSPLFIPSKVFAFFGFVILECQIATKSPKYFFNLLSICEVIVISGNKKAPAQGALI